MRWKKTGLSDLIWVGYTLLTVAALVRQGRMLCAEAGLADGWGIVAALLYLGAVGGIVLFFHRTAQRRTFFAEEKRGLLLALEAALAVALLAGGLALRVSAFGEAAGGLAYYEMAKVEVEKQLPQMAHGATYFYVWLLHDVFLLFGNQYAMGIVLQIALQLAASVGLYFLLRNLAGAVPALTAFGFCMCGPYLLRNVLTLSPGALYFFLFVIAAALIVFFPDQELSLPEFGVIGILIAFYCYLDINGLLLAIFAVAAVFSEREGVSVGRKLAVAGTCLAGTALAFFGFFHAEAFLKGEDFWRVLEAWLDLYRVEAFQLPVPLGTEGLVLSGGMAFGIFSFWRDRKRDAMSPYAVAACAVLLAGCFGIFAEGVPGFDALYLLSAILAGISLEQCLRGTAPQTSAAESVLPVEAPPAKGETPTQYLENPLPLPKKHEKRVFRYPIEVPEHDDFDHPVRDGDDFDI